MHLDMDSDHDDVTDYSSFEYQTVVAELILKEADDSTGGTNQNVKALFSAEPLETINGLDNNEVAELVSLETHASIEFEDASADQNVSTVSELRGAVGVNLPASASALPGDGTVGEEAEIFSTRDISESNIQGVSQITTDDRFLQLFESRAASPFDDQTNGPGGAGSVAPFHNTKNFRDSVGRGPVLDANDDLSISMLLTTGDAIINHSGVVRTHLVWDVAETDDSGRRFSVPMDD